MNGADIGVQYYYDMKNSSKVKIEDFNDMMVSLGFIQNPALEFQRADQASWTPFLAAYNRQNFDTAKAIYQIESLKEVLKK